MVRIQKLSLLFMLLFVTTFANAQELKYRLIEGTTDQLEVYNDNNTYFSGDIVIQPEAQYNGQNLPVNGIAKDAFKGSDAMTSISIPASVVKADSLRLTINTYQGEIIKTISTF